MITRLVVVLENTIYSVVIGRGRYGKLNYGSRVVCLSSCTVYTPDTVNKVRA